MNEDEMKARALYLLELSYEDWKKKEFMLMFPTMWADGEHSVSEGTLSKAVYEQGIFTVWLNCKEVAIKELRDQNG